MPATSFEDPKLQALLEKIVHKEGFKQPKTAITTGSNPGDNFVGRIYRVVITEEDDSNRSLSVIFKVSPLNQLRREVLSSDKLFVTESKTYQSVLPTLAEFLKKHGVIESSIFPGTARCLEVDLADPSKPNEPHVLVLEDKAPEGYRMGNRVKGLDVDQVRIALEKVAYLHAASLAMHYKEPETAERLRNEIHVGDLWYYQGDHPLLDDLKIGVLKCLQMLKEPYRKGNPVYDRLEKLVENFQQETIRSNEFAEDLPLFCHGDFTVNNLLFKYNKDGAVEDACLVDFQIIRPTSPAVDLLNLLFLSTTKATRDAHYDDLLRSYHQKVSSILRTVGCDPDKVMPWDLLQDHLRRYGSTAVFLPMMGIPVFMAENSDISVDVNSTDHEGSVFSADVSDPQKLEEMSQALTDAISDAARLGYF